MSNLLKMALFFVCCTCLCAQSNLARIDGVIKDPVMNAVPGAKVRARSAETGAVRAATTGLAGQFEFPGLTSGPYTIEVEAQGFAASKHDLRLEVGQSARLDFNLAVGETTTSIDVQARAETLK